MAPLHLRPTNNNVLSKLNNFKKLNTHHNYPNIQNILRMINNNLVNKMYNKFQFILNNNYYINQDKRYINQMRDKILLNTKNKYPSLNIFHNCLCKVHRSYFFQINMFLMNKLYKLLLFLRILYRMFHYMANICFHKSNRRIHMFSNFFLNCMLHKEKHIHHIFSYELHLI